MYKVKVMEKVLGKLVLNTYTFSREDQMLMFKQMCEEDGVLVFVQKAA